MPARRLCLLLAVVVVAVVAAAPGGRAADAGYVRVDGHRMYYECSGKGAPTVVLDAGSPDTSVVWRYVQPQIAEHTRVCAYDRAGLGKSSPASTGKRTPLTQVRELRGLLAAASLPAPYLVVGHSWGGLLARLFAWTYPHQTAGVVLLDATTFPYLTPETVKRLPGKSTTREHIDKASAVAESATIRTLGRLPLIVLGSNKPPLNSKLLGAQEAEAALSTDSIDATARYSTHYIQLPPPKGQPELVISAVEAMLTAIRTPHRLPACTDLFPTAAVLCRRTR